MTGEEIIKVLDKLIGEVEVVGDSYEDAKRLQNLNALIEVMDWCLGTLLFVQEAMYRKEYSMFEIGNTADFALRKMKRILDEHL